MTYYVYTYSDPITQIPFYVGKGTGLRMYKHLKETYENTENKKKYGVIKGLKNKGLEPVVQKIATELDESDAYELEAFIIAELGRRDLDEDGILTNICLDNRPPSAKGIKRTAEQKAHSSKMKKGELNPMYGKPAPNRGKPGLSGEDNPFYGRSHTEETRAIMSEKAQHRKIIKGCKPVQTPHGVYQTSALLAKEFNITNKLARCMIKHNDLTITARKVRNNPLLKEEHIGKTYKEIGYYEL